jgi:hypothetical protein
MEPQNQNNNFDDECGIIQKFDLVKKKYDKLLANNLALEKLIKNDIRSPINSAVYALFRLNKL